jgi:hypothetical protein
MSINKGMGRMCIWPFRLLYKSGVSATRFARWAIMQQKVPMHTVLNPYGSHTTVYEVGESMKARCVVHRDKVSSIELESS